MRNTVLKHLRTLGRGGRSEVPFEDLSEQPEIHGDERKSGREEHLRGGESFLDAPRPRPEKPLEIDARFARRLRIEVAPPIDERRRFAAGRRRRERREDDGETSVRAAAHELRQAAFELFLVGR